MARRRTGKTIDNVRWSFGGGGFSAQAAGTAAVTMFPAQDLPQTLLRIRGEFFAAIDGASAPGKFIEVGLGLIAVPEGTSATVLWSPVTDGSAPWIWVDYANLGYEEMVTDVIDVPIETAVRRVIDSKAMRRLRNQEIQLVVENTTLQSASAVNIRASVRVLFGT